jgi:serine/threonine protein kinase
MREFTRELDDYLSGNASVEALSGLIDRHVSRGESVETVSAALRQTYLDGRLGEDDYRRLTNWVNDQTRVEAPPDDATKVIDLDETVVAAPRPSPQPADTVLTMKTGTATLTTKSLQQPSTLGDDSAPDFDVGDTVKDRFVLEEILGVGGMGKVFKAVDLRKVEANDKDPFVALKLLNREFRDNPMALIALQRETKRAQTLSHPNIIHVYDFDREGQNVFMSMEYLTGQPLSRYIRELPETGNPFKRAWPIIEAMALALGHAHKKGIVHSDFKPGNVFINDQGEVKVLDFGIACALSNPDKPAQDATIFNARDLGALTPAYASLEQINNQSPDPRDDIYALACVSYELLAGKHPYGRLSAEKAVELKLQPQPLSQIKGRQWKGLQRALALQQRDRTPTVEAFLRDLQPSNRWYYLGGAAAVLAAVTTANVYFTVLTPQAPPPPIAVQLTADQQQKIKDLLELASIHFDVGYLTAPTGSNALWAYQEVLKIDPYSQDAQNGIKKIANSLEQQAWEAFERGDRIGSMKKVQEGLEVDPNHQGLKQLKDKLGRG